MWNAADRDGLHLSQKEAPAPRRWRLRAGFNPIPTFPILGKGFSGGVQSSSASLHRGAGASPHGMIGTVDVEFFGDPSISLSV